MQLLTCPGCGAEFESSNTTLEKDFNALTICRNVMYQISYFTLSLQDTYFLHQLAVDAYAVQHASDRTKPILLTFGLVGLYLVWEKNYTGRQVQKVHMELAKTKKVWPEFAFPVSKTWLTVQDVVSVQDGEKLEMIKTWNNSVWSIWKENAVEKVEVLLQRIEKD